MVHGLESGVKQLALSNAPLSTEEVERVSGAIAQDFSNYRLLREGVQELETIEEPTPAGKVRLGVCYYLLGKYGPAIETLSRADGSALALFYLAKARFANGEYPGAIEGYSAAAQAGYNRDICTLGRAEALRYCGDPHAAMAALDELSGGVEQSAEYLYQRGSSVAAIGGNPNEVVALLERAVEADKKHPGALFRLAMENDRRGNDEWALELYQRSTARVPAHVGSLLNLGIMYEDRQMYDRAQQCYRRILDAFPNNERARLFCKDARASGDMYYDDDAQRRRDRMGQVLNIPVTDFELSVRSRNCLQKMGIMTLGDLTRSTEQELLASKNFGETSLVEIKEMLETRGLSLGQFAPEKHVAEMAMEIEVMSPDEQAMLNKPIAELNLSVRARKCMSRLGVNTIGELVRRTGDELLECKNFGVTSLNEVREKLGSLHLKLRGD